jgi:hypothetical protein
MGHVVTAIRDGELKLFEPIRCRACRRMISRANPALIDVKGFGDGPIIEEHKCRCDAFTLIRLKVSSS